MEATGHYWLNLYTWLYDKNFTVHVINPIQSDAMRKLEIRKTKTDSIDAYLIADCIRLGKFCDTNLADDDMLALRDLTRQRFYLVDMTSDIKKKVIAMMDRIFPEYESLFSYMFGKTSRDLLKECSTPEEILRKSSKGRFKTEKAEELQKTARNSFSVLLSSKTSSLLVKQMIEQIELLEEQISELEIIIEDFYSKFDCKLTKIPGMGTTLAAANSIKKWDPSFVYAFQKKLDSSKNKSQALGFITHKLLNIVFSVLKNNIDYVPIFPPDVDVSKLAKNAINYQFSD